MSANVLLREPEQHDGLYMTLHELAIVRAVLAEHLPGRLVWVFGSRATGVRLKTFSDLDLAVEGRLSLGEAARLDDAFDECPLNWKVDVVELGTIEAAFRERIEKDFVQVQAGQPRT